MPADPGNSGGPLFNTKGEVVGINAQIYSETGGYMGLSFAIPINIAADVAEQLKTKGVAEHGWLGVAKSVHTYFNGKFFEQSPTFDAIADKTFGSPH